MWRQTRRRVDRRAGAVDIHTGPGLLNPLSQRVDFVGDRIGRGAADLHFAGSVLGVDREGECACRAAGVELSGARVHCGERCALGQRIAGGVVRESVHSAAADAVEDVTFGAGGGGEIGIGVGGRARATSGWCGGARESVANGVIGEGFCREQSLTRGGGGCARIACAELGEPVQCVVLIRLVHAHRVADAGEGDGRDAAGGAWHRDARNAIGLIPGNVPVVALGVAEDGRGAIVEIEQTRVQVVRVGAAGGG